MSSARSTQATQAGVVCGWKRASRPVRGRDGVARTGRRRAKHGIAQPELTLATVLRARRAADVEMRVEVVDTPRLDDPFAPAAGRAEAAAADAIEAWLAGGDRANRRADRAAAA